jgi:hypothetical protein
MSIENRDRIRRALREFHRFTGDGLPGEPTGAPLPIGDPQSGVHSPKKAELRDALEPIALALGQAQEAAALADARADDAASFAGFRDYQNVATLLANTSLEYGAGASQVAEGDIIRTRVEGFAYEVAAAGASDQDEATAGGVNLYVRSNSVEVLADRSSMRIVTDIPDDERWLYDSFPASSNQGNALFGSGIKDTGDADTVRTTAFGSLILTKNLVSDRNTLMGQGVLRHSKYSQRIDAFGSIACSWGGANLDEDPTGSFYQHPVIFNGNAGAPLVLGTPGAYTLNPDWVADNAFNLDADVGQAVVDWMNTEPWATESDDFSYIQAFGRDALNSIVKGKRNAAFGYRAMGLLVEGEANTALGNNALFKMAFGSGNTAVGRVAGWNLQEGDNNVYLGLNAGRSHYAGNGSVIIGPNAGFYSGFFNASWSVLLGQDAGIRADGTIPASIDNHLYIQDRFTRKPLLSGSFSVGRAIINGFPEDMPSASFTVLGTSSTVGSQLLRVEQADANICFIVTARGAGASGWGSPNSIVRVGSSEATGRSLNAGGTLNASGADYAEYFEVIEPLHGAVAKGDVLGVNANGFLTNVFADVVGPFLVKSTSPNLVGNDKWSRAEVIAEKYGVEIPGDEPDDPGELDPRSESESDRSFQNRATDHEKQCEQYQTDYAAWAPIKAAFDTAVEAERARWDRMALRGQVPANVQATDADIGKHVVPGPDADGGIALAMIADAAISFDEYRRALGRVISVGTDGRAIVLV